VTDWREYSADTRAALAAVSQGSCYFPGCGTPIVVLLGERPVINVEITHIREFRPGRPRYVAGLTEADGHSFDNVLLLCVPHRTIVDQDNGSRPIDLLDTWKAQREATGRGALAGVPGLTDDRLDQLLATAFSAVREQIAEALARFEEVDPDSARLVRKLADDLGDQRRHAAGYDTAMLLARVTDRLGELEGRLLKAAETISRLEDRATNAEPVPKRANIGWTT